MQDHDRPPAGATNPAAVQRLASKQLLILLKQLLNAETRFLNPQMFLSLHFQCRNNVSELKKSF